MNTYHLPNAKPGVVPIKTKLTAYFLLRHGACSSQVDLFNQVFPHGARITKANVIKAGEVGLSLWWLSELVLLRSARHAFTEEHTRMDRLVYSHARRYRWTRRLYALYLTDARNWTKAALRQLEVPHGKAHS